ncbi:MAG: hypothetical protein R3C69_03175 [Geminicoccaceae bacterium]
MAGAVRRLRRRLERFPDVAPSWRAVPARLSLPLVTAAVAGLIVVALAVELAADLNMPGMSPATPSPAPAADVVAAESPLPPAAAAFDWDLVEPATGPFATDPPRRHDAPSGDPGIAAPTSLPVVPEAPPELADVALELQQRREQLLELEARLAIREAALRAAEADLAAQLDRLEALRGELQELVGLANTEEEERQQQLVKVYESMRAKSAAQIFDRLDLAVLLPVAKRMKEVKMAAILAAMNPDRARLVTTELAREQSLPTLN